jgi:hypothetical protein
MYAYHPSRRRRVPPVVLLSLKYVACQFPWAENLSLMSGGGPSSMWSGGIKGDRIIKQRAWCRDITLLVRESDSFPLLLAFNWDWFDLTDWWGGVGRGTLLWLSSLKVSNTPSRVPD